MACAWNPSPCLAGWETKFLVCWEIPTFDAFEEVQVNRAYLSRYFFQIMTTLVVKFVKFLQLIGFDTAQKERGVASPPKFLARALHVTSTMTGFPIYSTGLRVPAVLLPADFRLA